MLSSLLFLRLNLVILIILALQFPLSASYIFNTCDSLRAAIKEWFSNKSAAQAKYGTMNSWDISLVDDMSYMFDCDYYYSWGSSIYNNCLAFNENISSWNVARVTDMECMFRSATLFNQILSRWNVASVTNMSYMFSSAESFNQNLSNWNVASVNNMSGMFFHAKSFNQSMSNWNVARVSDMSGMFGYAESFNQSMSNWNVARVTDMSHMFSSATSFNQKLCWTVTGKDTTDMMYGTNGASAVECAPSAAKPSAVSASSVVVGVSVPIVLIAVGILIFVIMRKRRRASHKPDPSSPPSNKDTFEGTIDLKADDKIEECTGEKPHSTLMESEDSFKWKRVDLNESYLNRK